MKKTSAHHAKSKKTAAHAKPKTRSVSKTSFIDNYYRQTDEFFLAHPHSRVLIGIFIVVYVMFLGLFFHDKAQALGWADGGQYYLNTY